jgi:hypothetical protein
VTTTATPPTGPAQPPLPQPSPAAQLPSDPGPGTGGETSFLGRYVALLTPFFAIAAGWVAAWVAQHIPGTALDQTQLISFMIAATTAALGAALKWLHGWQQHERLVAAGSATRRGPAPVNAGPTGG